MKRTRSEPSIYTDPKYGQPVRGWTAKACAVLSENEGNVEIFLKALNDYFIFKSQAAKERKNKIFTHKESVSLKMEKAGGKSRARSSKEKLINDKELYARTLYTIESYYTENSERMNLRDKFLLHYFWSRICAQLHDYNEAFKHDQEVIKNWEEANLNKTNENWVEEFNTERLIPFLHIRMAKHKLMAEGPLSIESLPEKCAPRKPEEILTSKTYIEKGTEKSTAVEEMVKYYERLRQTKFSTLILQITALNALEHDTFGIFFSPSMGQEFAGGYYLLGSKVQIKEVPIEDWQTAYFHELTHMAMDRLFCNHCNPYAKGDIEAQDAYHECMRQVILNVIEDTIPIQKLEKLECNKDHTIEPKSLFTKPFKINFPHPWSKSLSAEQLIENCYGPKGLLLGDSYGVGLELQSLFTSNNYSMSDYDSEFVTYMSQNLIADPMYKNRKELKPFMDYLDKYVNPKIEKYIKGHPSKSKVIL